MDVKEGSKETEVMSLIPYFSHPGERFNGLLSCSLLGWICRAE